MTTVTYFGLKGIYMGFDVYDSVPVHCNYKRANINNSCVTMQMYFDSQSDANSSNYNLNLLPNGKFSFEGSISAFTPNEWADYTMIPERTPVLGVNLKNGTINGGDCTNYTLEFFIPYASVGLDGAPKALYIAPAIRSYDSEDMDASAVSSVRLHEEKEELRSQGLWTECFYAFDENGLISNEISFDNGSNGEVKEFYGRDYTLKDVPARFVILPNEGYRLKNITANGKDVLDRITIKNGEIILDLGYVNEDLEISSTFEEISSANVTLTGEVNNTANYDISKLKMILTDGAKIYNVSISENGEYSATVPMGKYVALYVLNDRVVKVEKIDLSKSAEVNVNTSGKVYVSDFVVNSPSVHKRIAEIGTEFIAEYFIGMEKLNFDYNESKEEFFGGQVIFRTKDNVKIAFQLLRWDNRIIFKNVNDNLGTTFMTLLSGSTTANPKYVTDFPDEIAESLIENNGLTVAIDRSGEIWNAYVRVGNKYYLMLENVKISGITEADNIENIWLQSATATNENNAFVKDMTVWLYPTEDIIPEERPMVVSSGSNTQIKSVDLGQKFRMEVFVGMDELDFNYWTEGNKQKYNLRIILSIDGTVGAGVFSLLGYDNRVMLKDEKNNNAIKLFVLSQGSTTENPLFTSDYPEAVASAIIQNKGITLVIERNGELWNTYVKVEDTYYLVHKGVSIGTIGTANITNVLFQCPEVSNTNRAYIKEFVIDENPADINKCVYRNVSDTSADSGESVVIASGDFGTKFRVETFIGQENLNLTYDASATSDVWKTTITFRGADNTKTGFFLFRYGNRIIFRDGSGSVAKTLFAITENGYAQGAGSKFSDATMQLLAQEIATKNGITIAIDRDGKTWTAYIKIGENYYKVGSVEVTSISETVSVSSIEIYGGLGTSSTNPSYAKWTEIVVNPDDTIIEIEG
jgi:hypothetical protein